MKHLTAEWIKKAEDDFEAAKLVAAGKRRAHDIVCFHCQQAAEKYLKAVLQDLNIAFPRTHDLTALLLLFPPTEKARLRRLVRGLDFLSKFAVEPRYPIKWTTKRQGAAALRWADNVRTACRNLLGL